MTVKHSGELYEITTFRTEGAYSDGRHPDEVAFVPDVREDLARRDFTINAMAYNAEEGLIDPFGGQDDLAAGIVRAVGEPPPPVRRRRPAHPAALPLRGPVRLCHRPGHRAGGQSSCAAHLDCVSVERIEEELSQTAGSTRTGAYLEAEVLAVILPELSTRQSFRKAGSWMPARPGRNTCPVRLAALLCALGEDGTREALKRLRCSNALIGDGGDAGGGESGAFSSDTNRAIPCPPYCLRQQGPTHRTVFGGTPALCLRKSTPRIQHDSRTSGQVLVCTCVEQLDALCGGHAPEQAAEFAAQAELARQLEADGACCRVNQLAVNGRDLMDGRRPGRGRGCAGCWKRCWNRCSPGSSPTRKRHFWPRRRRSLRLDKRTDAAVVLYYCF